MAFGVALAALAIEAGAGYPDWLFARIGHPVTWIGKLIDILDHRLNRDAESFALRRAKGVAALLGVAAAALGAGVAIVKVTDFLPFGWLLQALLASTLIAQRSLDAHVAAVPRALTQGLAEGRREVGKIVGRDVTRLDDAGVIRAAIESLAENFSDGVVAPTLFLALFGLPGALLYKAVNTADSMIGHKSERYRAFGWAAARCDDLFNLAPARLTAALIALAARITPGADARAALVTALRDARRHASPNAGWPEAAMAGALGLALGGPRAYHGATVEGAMLGRGRRNATLEDIFRALTIYRLSAALLWLMVLVVATVGIG